MIKPPICATSWSATSGSWHNAQCCIDICHRIISQENARKPTDYYDAILRMGELDILPPDFARHLAPLAGFRNILVHEYLALDWDHVYRHLETLEDMERFAGLIRRWLQKSEGF